MPRNLKLRGTVLETLLRDSELSQTGMDVKVSNGWITLRPPPVFPGAGGIT